MKVYVKGAINKGIPLILENAKFLISDISPIPAHEEKGQMCIGFLKNFHLPVDMRRNRV